jgi:hypothetical protein
VFKFPNAKIYPVASYHEHIGAMGPFAKAKRSGLQTEPRRVSAFLLEDDEAY